MNSRKLIILILFVLLLLLVTFVLPRMVAAPEPALEASSAPATNMPSEPRSSGATSRSVPQIGPPLTMSDEDKKAFRDEEAAGQLSVADRTLTWRARQKVAEIEESMVLSKEEHDRLQNAFELKLREIGGPSDGLDRFSVLAGIIGEERAQAVAKKASEKRKLELKNKIDNELILFSHKLSLAPEQESKVRKALEETDSNLQSLQSDLAVKMSDAMALHGASGSDAREALQALFDEIKELKNDFSVKRKDLLLAKLRPVLNDDQMNKFSALQEEDPNEH